MVKYRGSDFKEIMTAEFISTTGGIFAGFLLGTYINKLDLIPGLFILLPGFLEMRGNISGSLSARLSAALFLNAIKPKLSKQRLLKGNVIATFILVFSLSTILGIIAYFISSIFFNVNNVSIIFVALIAGIISNLIEIPLTIVTTFWLYKRGYDPNNIMGPYVTTSGDIISVVSLLLALAIV